MGLPARRKKRLAQAMIGRAVQRRRLIHSARPSRHSRETALILIRSTRARVAFEGETRTFGELDERAKRLAAALAARGVGAGDKVAILMYNRIEFVESLPRTATGKLQKFKLREPFWAGHDRQIH